MKKKIFISLICIMVSAAEYLPAGAAVATFDNVKSKPEYPGLRKKRTHQNDSELLNKPAPDFNLSDMHGQPCSLKDLKGKIVVLNFWFIACKPCVNEMPVLNGIKNKYDPTKIVFLALSLDNKDAVNTFLQQHQFDYIQLPDAAAVHKKYHLNAYPVSIVINARGIVSFVQTGGPDINENLPIAIGAALKKA
jgi:peroxiredoxin